MRGKSSSSKSRNIGPEPVKQNGPHVWGTRDDSNMERNETLEEVGGFSDQKTGNSNGVPHKKARRRLHTSRPYQERLLNMAEARREIVTALKFHRAAMKQKQLEPGPKATPFGPASHHMNSWRNPQLNPSSSSSPRNHCSYPENISSYCSPDTWHVPLPIMPPPITDESLDFALPSQTLGLNLNLQEFFNYTDLSTANPPYSISSSSPSSSPFSDPVKELPTAAAAHHHAINDKEMAEMRSIGEQYQMEWNDSLNLVTSAWWFEFFKSMEDKKDEDLMNYVFEDAVDFHFPAWLNEKEDEPCSGNYFQASGLPCMDMEEMDSIDGDWLA